MIRTLLAAAALVAATAPLGAAAAQPPHPGATPRHAMAGGGRTHGPVKPANIEAARQRQNAVQARTNVKNAKMRTGTGASSEAPLNTGKTPDPQQLKTLPPSPSPRPHR